MEIRKIYQSGVGSSAPRASGKRETCSSFQIASFVANGCSYFFRGQGLAEGKSSLGFIELSTGGRELIGSEGFDFGVSSRMTVDLKNNNGVIILSNGHLNSDVRRRKPPRIS